MRFRGPELSLFALILCSVAWTGSAHAGALWSGMDHGPVKVGYAEGVVDPLFAFLVDVTDRGLYGEADASLLDSLARAGGGSRLPIELFESVSRRPSSKSDARLRLRFVGPVKTPIPYSILKYNPGSIRASRIVELEHWELGSQSLRLPSEKGDSTVVLEAEDLDLFVISAGSIVMDIDGWLDKLLRGKLDDVDLSGFLLFREGDRRIGLGFGYTGGHKGRTGAFDLSRDESIFPAPRPYLSLGRRARELGERLRADPAAPRILSGAETQP